METLAIGIVICTLSTWRIAHMLCFEDGPCDCLEKLRALPFLKDLFSCFYCTSVWVALPHAILLFDASNPIQWIGHAFITSMAISTLAIFTYEGFKRIAG
jgi:hypothetical protein